MELITNIKINLEKTARDYAKSRNEFDKVELLDGY